jgi:beta-xylosidase
LTGRRALGRAALWVAAAALAAGTAVAQRVASVFDGADPSALFVGGRLWVYPTGKGDALAAWSSPDERHWSRPVTLIRRAEIGWIATDGATKHQLWAPDMLAANGRYYLYYAVGPQDPTPSRLGVALCTGPAGPCRDSGRPLLTGGNGFEAIDPNVFIDPRDGKALLYAGGSAGATLRVFELGRDLTSIGRELPVTQPPGFTEGVFMHRRNGIYYLSYSHGHWNRSDYSVHYCTAPSPTGPWTYRGIILQGDAHFKGPGHHAFVRDPRTGKWLIVYHRWENVTGDGPYTRSRRVAIQPIRYRADGTIEPIRME